jgi:hypothetical protein
MWVGRRGGEGRFFSFEVCYVESGLSPIHFPLGQWTVDFPCKLSFGGRGSAGGLQKG